jgi:hypothetical protein
MGGTKSSNFFWSDWQSDPGLRLSSFAARGLWMDMLCIAAQAKGMVEIGGNPLTDGMVAKAIGGDPKEVAELISELEKNNVFSRDRRGCIYSRRMRKSEINRSNGALAGPKKLLNLKQNQKSLGEKSEPLIPIPSTKSLSKEDHLPKESPRAAARVTVPAGDGEAAHAAMFSELDLVSDDGLVVIRAAQIEEYEREFPKLTNVRGQIRLSLRLNKFRSPAKRLDAIQGWLLKKEDEAVRVRQERVAKAEARAAKLKVAPVHRVRGQGVRP